MLVLGGTRALIRYIYVIDSFLAASLMAVINDGTGSIFN